MTRPITAAFIVMVTGVAHAQQNPYSHWRWPTAPSGPCEYHAISSTSVAMVLTITEKSRSLRPDGRGQYWSGNDNARSYANLSYNLSTYQPETCIQSLRQPIRELELRLDQPVEGVQPRGVVRTKHGHVHVFPPNGSTEPIHRMQVGASEVAARTAIRFDLDDGIYYLRLGPTPHKALDSLPAIGVLPGEGTSSVRIVHDAADRWRIFTEGQGVARLSKWESGNRVTDLGLYRFDFDLDLCTQRPEERLRSPDRSQRLPMQPEVSLPTLAADGRFRVEDRDDREGGGGMAASYRDNPPITSRDCTVPGCGGTMRFNPQRQEAAGLHTLEWPWRASWVCDRNAAHFEVATAADESALTRRGDRR